MNDSYKKYFINRYKKIKGYKKYGRIYAFKDWFSYFPFSSAVKLIDILSETKVIEFIKKCVFYFFVFLYVLCSFPIWLVVRFCVAIKHMIFFKDVKEGINSFLIQYEDEIKEASKIEGLNAITFEITVDILRLGKETGIYEPYEIVQRNEKEFEVYFKTWLYLENDNTLSMISDYYDKYKEKGIQIVFSVGSGILKKKED